MTELVFIMQNINSTYFQPFVLFTAAAGLYVMAAFLVDLLFRLLEGGLSYPNAGALKRFLTRKKRAQVQQLMELHQ
jgi:uncharacterized integral membrane protein